MAALPPGQLAAILTGLPAAAGPVVWNAILRATPASQFFTDAPLAAVTGQLARHRLRRIALATATVLLGVGPLAAAPARRTASGWLC
ncbi:MAG TPA: hypothetical protein VFC13_14255 [Actinomycetes bacterium]|nr:hypothetical protein [Actinomycetes bacterium]